MERAVVLLVGDAVEKATEVIERLKEADITVKQRFDDVRVSSSDVDRFLELSDLNPDPADETAPVEDQGAAKGGKKGAPAAKKGEKAAADKSADSPSAEALAEALREPMQRGCVALIVGKHGLYGAPLDEGIGTIKECGVDGEGSVRALCGGSPSTPLVLRTRNRDSSAAHVEHLLELLTREASSSSGRADDPHGRSEWVSEDLIFKIAFPPGVLHPRSTGRLLVFAEYGPLDRDGNLRAGVRGSHVATARELRTMIDVMEEEDALRVFVPTKGMTGSERRQVLKEASAALRHFESLTRERVRRLLTLVRRDEEGRYSFHEFQRVLQDWRERRVHNFKRMFPDLVGANVDQDGVEKAAERVRVHVRANPLARKIRETEQFKVLSATLHRQTHHIASLDQGNDPQIPQNVRLLRDETEVEGKPQWDDLCSLRQTQRGSYVRAKPGAGAGAGGHS